MDIFDCTVSRRKCLARHTYMNFIYEFQNDIYEFQKDINLSTVMIRELKIR